MDNNWPYGDYLWYQNNIRDPRFDNFQWANDFPVNRPKTHYVVSEGAHRIPVQLEQEDPVARAGAHTA